MVELADGTRRPMTREEFMNPQLLPNGAKIFCKDKLTSQGESKNSSYPVEFENKIYKLPRGHWTTTIDGMK